MSDQPELKEFPEFPGEPMSKRYDTTRNPNPNHPSAARSLARSTRFLIGICVQMMFRLDACMDDTDTDTDDEG